jgi:hypothetical protein
MGENGNGRFAWRGNQKMLAASYARDLEGTRNLPFREKFAGLFQLCEQARTGRIQIVVVAFPEVLGDDYDELVRNIGMCAEAGLLLAVAQQSS